MVRGFHPALSCCGGKQAHSQQNIFRAMSISKTISSAISFALCLSVAAPALVSAQQLPSPALQQRIQADNARHHDGDDPQNPGPFASDVSSAFTPGAVAHAMRKVGDWELHRAQPYFGDGWTWGVLYAGVMAAGSTLHDRSYIRTMNGVGKKFDWQLHTPLPIADNQVVGQMYTEMYMRRHKPIMIANTRHALDALIANENAPAKRIPWWWCDALFMAPPVWVRMHAITHDPKYLAYLDHEWWKTSDLLYDPQEHLYFRDASYLHRTEPNGQKMFWSRGNGWVLAGLARTLEYLPKSDPDYSRYVTQFQQMSAKLASIQGSDGLWTSGLLDPAYYGRPELSGSGLMTFGLAWGIHQGLLPRDKYLPVVQRAWAGLVHHIYASGRLGDIQQVGAAPAFYRPSSSYNYGIGGFLLAGSQVYRLAKGHP